MLNISDVEVVPCQDATVNVNLSRLQAITEQLQQAGLVTVNGKCEGRENCRQAWEG